MIKINLLNSSVATAIALSGSALAGDVIAEAAAPAPSNNGDWCAGLETFGKFYKNEDATFIQSLKFFGRFQYQYAKLTVKTDAGDSLAMDSTRCVVSASAPRSSFSMALSSRVNVNLVRGRQNGPPV